MSWRLALVSGVIFLFSFSGCTKAPERKEKGVSSSATESGSDAISVFTLAGHTETGRKKWEIQGQTADLMGEVVHLSPVTATSFGEVQVYLTSFSGRFHKVTQNAHLEGDVVVTTSDGVRLTTDSFDWIAPKGTGTTPDWVTVTRPGMTVLGRGGVSHPKVKRVRLERSVTVTLQGGAGKTVVTCDGPLEVDYGRGKARFWRNVRVRDARGLIRSDRMDVLLDPQTRGIKRATCWGHVEILHNQQRATSNRANYWQFLGKTQLIGHPKIVLLAEEEIGE